MRPPILLAPSTPSFIWSSLYLAKVFVLFVYLGVDPSAVFSRSFLMIIIAFSRRPL